MQVNRFHISIIYYRNGHYRNVHFDNANVILFFEWRNNFSIYCFPFEISPYFSTYLSATASQSSKPVKISCIFDSLLQKQIRRKAFWSETFVNTNVLQNANGNNAPSTNWYKAILPVAWAVVKKINLIKCLFLDSLLN